MIGLRISFISVYLTYKSERIKHTHPIIVFILLCITLPLIGCGDRDSHTIIDDTETTVDIFTKREWSVIQTLSPLPSTPPPNPTNRYADDPNAAQLGQKLFFDERFSKDGTVACATCHSPFHGFADVEATSLGAGRGTRNAPTLLNVAYNKWQFWDGRADTLWSQALIALEGEKEQAGTRLQFAHLIKRLYQADYEVVFGKLPDLSDTDRFPLNGKPGDINFDKMSDKDKIAINTVFANIGKAIEAYERLLISRNAPFDQYVAGDYNAIGIEAKRGLQLFIGKGVCILCHDTPNFTDNEFHNIGVPQGDLPIDTGRYDGIKELLTNPFNGGGIYSDSPDTPQRILDFLVPTQQHKGQFKTPTLRNVALTAPYFHTGEFASLESIIAFNNTGGVSTGFVGTREGTLEPLNLTEQEAKDLVEFLFALTGELPSEQLLRKPDLP